MSDGLSLYRGEFTDAQRRRVEALILVRVFLWPTIDPVTAWRIACWIASGSEKP